jgi:hypothetical protein
MLWNPGKSQDIATIVKMMKENKCCQECGDEEILVQCRCKTLQPLWKVAWMLPREVKIVTVWFSNLTTVITSVGVPISMLLIHICTCIHAALVTMAKIWKHLDYHFRWMSKSMWCVYAHTHTHTQVHIYVHIFSMHIICMCIYILIIHIYVFINI